MSGDVGYVDERYFPEGLRLNDLTFRELLNRLTHLKRGGWIVRIAKRDDKSDGAEIIEVYI